jgi:hypothetical protein
MNSSSPLTLTIPSDATYDFEDGTQIVIVQFGLGQVTFVGDSGVFIFSEGSRFITKARYAVASLIKLSANQWILTGNLVP